MRVTDWDVRGEGLVDTILGNSKDGIESDAGGDKVKETVPQDD
jgi:hypothetical protein